MAADTVALSALTLARGDKILVTVESALPDIVVVSFVHGAKCFQGALLDATKRGLPCGVQPPEPVPDPDGDKLATIAARFSYFQERKSTLAVAKADLRRNINPPARYKNARPTVRLRPRQVLCSKCRSICNENSENVDVSRKRKHDDVQQPQQQQVTGHGSTRRSDRRCGQQPQKTSRILFSECQSENIAASAHQATKSSSSAAVSPDSSKLGPSLIPKISRLQPNEISNAIQGTDKVKIAPSYWNNRAEEGDSSVNAMEPGEERMESTDCDSNPSMAYCATPRRLSSSSVESAKIPEEDEKKTFAAADSTMRPRTGRVPRKKRSVGSMEDLWDETVFEDPTRTARTTPVIKISFGAQGEGTVLKIPSKIQDPEYEQETDDAEDGQTETERDPLELPRTFENDYDFREDGEEDGQEQVDPQKQGVKDASAKAAKRALKKAKKEARRKMLGGVSPARSPCNGSPRYNPTYDTLSYHRRKHKVKHKKKHKEDRKHKSQQQPQQQQPPQPCLESSATENQQNWNVLPGSESYTAIKEQCLKQKLSISLKRLNTNAYARCDYPVSNASSGCKSPGASSDELSEQEPEVDAGETAPDFPPPSHPLMMRLAATPVEHCLTANGRRMDVGDVVWGKIHGFPWWPGKVLSITVSCKEDGTSSGPQAHVAWYGSSTSSLMACDQLSPFLESFKTRYNKKKRGPYKEAIRQAQNEARSQITPNSTSSVLNVCGSPREVNVLS